MIDLLGKNQTIVVKVGSKIITDGDKETYTERITRLAESIGYLKESGHSVALVSSGAVAFGMKCLQLKEKPKTIPLKQACASVGQGLIMEFYSGIFSLKKMVVGQVLLSKADLYNKESFLNLRNTLLALFDAEVVPIINENDSVGIEELRYGDNDTLGAQISMLLGSDIFINLTDITGLYTANPKVDSSAKHIPVVKKITKSHKEAAGLEGTSVGVGGMFTKIRAAEMVCKSGITAIIGDGFNNSLLEVLKNENLRTLFVPADSRLSARQRWIKFTGKQKGSIVVDEGAKKALLQRGKSLLPAGIIDVLGSFTRGDIVEIVSADNKLLARGITNYTCDELKTIMGLKTEDIHKVLAVKVYNVAVHRNNMVIVKESV